MHVFSGKSFAEDARGAVVEATAHWDTAGSEPEIVFVFASTKQEPAALARCLSDRFPRSLIVGCTTAGEHLSGEHTRGAVVLAAVCDSGIRWSATLVEGLAEFDGDRAHDAVAKLLEPLGANPDEIDPHDYFCISLIDGLRGCEESVTAHIAEALEGIRLVGGSAGDDLAFRETQVMFGGRAYTDALVLVMGHAKGRFEILKHQHFTRTSARLAVTKVDGQRRRVLEMDGLPAATAYARALGIPVTGLTDDVTFLNPVTLSCNGESFIRSIQKVHDDGSIAFYCAVEEGMVLEIGAHGDLVRALDDDLDGRTQQGGAFDFMLGCNCILRALEAERGEHVAAVGNAWRRAARVAIGFDTYGEQLDGLHINQTLVAIGIRGAA